MDLFCGRTYAFVALVLMVTSSLLSAQQTAPQAPATAAPAVPVSPVSDNGAQRAAPPSETVSTTVPKLRLGVGDLLEIAVFGVPELSQTVRVNDSGEVVLPLIGVVHLAGLTPENARRLIEGKLSDGGYVNNPHVSIFVKEYATQGISVMGEVTKPGIYPLLGAPRLYDVIAAAGGLTPAAGRVITITHRDQPGSLQTVTFDTDPAKSSSYNVAIFPGDTIVVSKASLVYVVGDVAQPGGFPIGNNERLSVLQAVALAHGANASAAVGKTKVIRRTPNGLQELPVPLGKILSAKAPDVALQPDDIVFVPGSVAKNAGRKTIESIVQIATGVAIYRR